MKELQVFNNEEFGAVRTLTINNEPYFVGKDVTDILGYINSRKALADYVDAEDMEVTKCDAPGGLQEMVVINASGLYSLIHYSKLPSAKRFKHWMISEVLPALRQHGMFVMNDIISNTDALIEVLKAYKEEHKMCEALEEENAVQKQQLAEMKSKASYYDVVLANKKPVSIIVIAKDYGWSADKLNEYLHWHGIQHMQGRIWILNRQYAEMGLTKTQTYEYQTSDGQIHTNVRTYWTPKGRLFIYNMLKADGIFPMIEKED